MTSLLFLALLPPVHGAPFGNPGHDPSVGLVGLEGTFDAGGRIVEAEGCGGESCAAVVRGVQAGLRASLHPASFVGAWGSVTAGSLRGDGFDHEGPGWSWAIGGHLTLPSRYWVRPALSVKADGSRGTDTDDAGATQSTLRLFALDVSAQLAVGDAMDGASLWLGPAASVLRPGTAELPVDGVTLELVPRRPVGGVIGGQLVSDGVGAPWRGDTRVTAGVEVRLVDAWTAGAWAGVAFGGSK